MRRVLVIGSAGAGKTTLAIRLGELLGLPVIHLDSLYWQPGWKETPKDSWRQIVAGLVQRKCWIMDGNYGGTLAERLKACDTVVFLAFSRYLCLFRVFRRGILNWGKARPDLNPGCPEHFPDRGFLSWIWGFARSRTPGILEALRACEPEKNIIILRSPSEVPRFLNTVARHSLRQE